MVITTKVLLTSETMGVVLPHRIIRLMEHRLQVQVSLRVEAQPMVQALSQVHLDLQLPTTTVIAVLQVDGMEVLEDRIVGQTVVQVVDGMAGAQVGQPAPEVLVMPILQLLGFLEVTHQRQHTK